MKKDFRVFILLIVSLFLSELLIMALLDFFPHLNKWAEAIIDATVLSIIIFPIIYNQLFKPLKESIAVNDENEAKIKYERNLFKALFDNLPDAVYVKDIQYRKILANPIDLQYMGINTEADIIGKTDAEIYNKEVSESSYADEQEIFKTGIAIINKENFFIDNRGEKHWMLNSKVPFRNNNNEIIGLVGISREITERKKEETRLKLLESVILKTNDAVVITEILSKGPIKNSIIFVNQSYSKMTGYSLEEVFGKSPALLQGVNTDKEILKKVKASMDVFEPCQYEVINYKKNGEEFWSSISLSPISDSQGLYTHWIAIKRDTTEKKLLEKNYIKAKESAESANRAKSDFLANMSHEIRTPLNSVIGFSDLLKKTKLDETQKMYNNAVFQSANSLLDIITEILDFSKIEAGKLEIDISKTDLQELAFGITNMVSFQAHEKNLEILLNLSNDIPRFIWADSLRLRQILINLMANAVKFTKKGEVELKIIPIKILDENKIILRFSVRDTGIGILPENQKKIFEAFTQEDASTTRKYGGTGLGLAISKRLLELMGSELKLVSEFNVGSTFFFDIVLKAQQVKADNLIDISKIKHALIVDDNANNRILVTDMLALKNVKSAAVESGKMALELLEQSNDFDLVLMDFNMSEMDGIETTREIRNRLKLGPEKLAIILLHSSAEDEFIIEACKELDLVGRLVKPIHMQNLYDCIAKSGHPSTQEIHSPTNGYVNNKKLKVLLADDNEFNILLVKQMINNILPNAQIFEAVNGIKAIELFEANQPDLVFMDIQMPELNGHEASEKNRSLTIGKHIPIIALTAGTQEDERERCIQAGMDDFITKPFVVETLEHVISKWLAN
ncbi:MAG: response regulator [Bacteroidetes bacterium]|nr:response regulator [Bacteroidota bacterium]